ncbi:MAG: hypothetical protein ACK44A_09425 [Roseateles sp.]
MNTVLRRACAALSMALAALPAAAVDHVATVWASGLNGPRGLAFAPDGSLWVAEAGVGAGAGLLASTVVRGSAIGLNLGGSLTRITGAGSQDRVLGGLPRRCSCRPPAWSRADRPTWPSTPRAVCVCWWVPASTRWCAAPTWPARARCWASC